MKKKLEEFLELEKKATEGPWERGDFWLVSKNSERTSANISQVGEMYEFATVYSTQNPKYSQEGHANAEFIVQSRTIAPLAVKKLIEAVELLEKVANMAIFSGKNDWDLAKEIKKFTEDFNNEN